MNCVEGIAITSYYISAIVEHRMKLADDVHLGAMLGREFVWHVWSRWGFWRRYLYWRLLNVVSGAYKPVVLGFGQIESTISQLFCVLLLQYCDYKRIDLPVRLMTCNIPMKNEEASEYGPHRAECEFQFERWRWTPVALPKRKWALCLFTYKFESPFDFCSSTNTTSYHVSIVY
jgi:hypothetical protein